MDFGYLFRSGSLRVHKVRFKFISRSSNSLWGPGGYSSNQRDSNSREQSRTLYSNMKSRAEKYWLGTYFGMNFTNTSIYREKKKNRFIFSEKRPHRHATPERKALKVVYGFNHGLISIFNIDIILWLLIYRIIPNQIFSALPKIESVHCDDHWAWGVSLTYDIMIITDHLVSLRMTVDGLTLVLE